jgi:hypothetical protein
LDNTPFFSLREDHDKRPQTIAQHYYPHIMTVNTISSDNVVYVNGKPTLVDIAGS